MTCALRRFHGVLFASLGIAAASGAAPPPDDILLPSVSPLRGALVAENRGYAVGHPEQIAGPNAMSVLVSPDSRYILTVCEERRTPLAATIRGKTEDAPGEQFLSCYDVQTRRTRILWRQAVGPGETAFMYGMRIRGWIPTGNTNTQRALAFLRLRNLSPTGERLPDKAITVLIDPVAGTARNIPVAFEDGVSPSPSHTQPFAAMIDDIEGGIHKSIRFMRPDGSMTTPITLPPVKSGHYWSQGWTDDGTEIRATDAEDYFAINPATGTFRKIPAPPKNADGDPTFPSTYADPKSPVNIPLRLIGKSVHEKKPQPVVLANQTGNEQVTLLPDGEPIALLPSGTGALVRVNGYLYLCPIQTVPATTVAEWQRKENREQTIALAKEFSGALFMHWDKNEHNLPPKDTNLKAALSPYLSEAARDAWNRFTYEPPSSLLISDFKALQEIRLGQFRSLKNDGVAIVYGLPRDAWEEARTP